jgi:NAD(P)-dependent dehydrogenase (short-subunit alcohol dehydrogenase family)
MSLHTKVALVTDADMPIGRALALGLTRAGWRVAVHYGRDIGAAQITADVIAYLAQKTYVVRCDLSNDAAVRTMLQEVEEKMGRVSCVINYGGLAEFDNTATFSAERLNGHMASHLTGPIVLTRALHASTPANQRSVAINLIDQKLQQLQPDFLSYTLAHAALQTATPMLAQALAPRTRVVGIACDMLPSAAIAHSGRQSARSKQSFDRTALSDMIAAVRFAAESPAVTGSLLLVNGGQHLVPAQPMAADRVF